MKLYKTINVTEGSGRLDQASLDDLKAALKEHGMVAVPVEPTEAMLEDGYGEALQDWDVDHEDIDRIYKAMISAAEDNNG